MKLKKKTVEESEFIIPKAKQEITEQPRPEYKSGRLAVEQEETLTSVEIKIALELLRGVIKLRQITQFSTVLSIAPMGYYVQTQVPVESQSAAGSGMKLEWKPITGIYTNPLYAVQAALAVPFGRNLITPPEPLETVTETPLDPPKEEEVYKPENAIIFPASAMGFGSLGTTTYFLIEGATSTKIYAKVKDSEERVVFNSVTGTSVNDLYQISGSVLAKINSAILAFNNMAKDKSLPEKKEYGGITDENSAQKETELVKEPVTETLNQEYLEYEELLKPLIGKQVAAQRRFPSGTGLAIVGEYRGKTYNTANGADYAVFGKSGGRNRLVIVLPESVKEA
jgi:hypothetical protein